MRILVALMEPTSGEANVCSATTLRKKVGSARILGYVAGLRFFAKWAL